MASNMTPPSKKAFVCEREIAGAVSLVRALRGTDYCSMLYALRNLSYGIILIDSQASFETPNMQSG